MSASFRPLKIVKSVRSTTNPKPKMIVSNAEASERITEYRIELKGMQRYFSLSLPSKGLH